MGTTQEFDPEGRKASHGNNHNPDCICVDCEDRRTRITDLEAANAVMREALRLIGVGTVYGKPTNTAAYAMKILEDPAVVKVSK